MKLYGYYRSSTSYRLRIALNLKNIDYEIVPVNLRSAEHLGGEFIRRNPFAGLPVLETPWGDRTQSMAIIEWLEEAYPQPPLLPADIDERFVARELASAIATELHAPLNLKVQNYLKENLGHSQDQVEIWCRHWMANVLGPLEARLEAMNTGAFLFGTPGLFETVLVPQLYNARRYKLDLSRMSRMTQIEAACLALPEFRRAHPDNQPDNPDGVSA